MKMSRFVPHHAAHGAPFARALDHISVLRADNAAFDDGKRGDCFEILHDAGLRVGFGLGHLSSVPQRMRPHERVKWNAYLEDCSLNQNSTRYSANAIV